MCVCMQSVPNVYFFKLVRVLGHFCGDVLLYTTSHAAMRFQAAGRLGWMV